MTAPKPGTPVRITINGRITEAGADGRGLVMCLTALDIDVDHIIVDDVDAEVLASPVYVNSDATEHHMGDLAQSADTGDLRTFIYRGIRLEEDGDAGWFEIADGRGNTFCRRAVGMPGRLTLLVRDGQPVRP